MRLLSEVNLDLDAGVSGRAVRTGQVEWTGAYLEDDRFEHTPERDAFVREAGIRSVISAPLIHREVAGRGDHGLRRPPGRVRRAPTRRCSARWPTTPPSPSSTPA